ncbi:hypothetical protein [Dyella tabacisoli]|uniref:LysM domain-containing protein n=1 Tax=Dyella tabacisoli TaxID=2282381 RepID=A0A369URA5_9GAMM|nr:hypothetical protein [Dyella tabacisoli]RDD83007.1 hypothetical protein DVJ77_03930 [Dyella tabacisoli]
MSLQTVSAALAVAITPLHTIDLYGAANGSADLAPLKPLLALFGITASYVLHKASLDPNTTSVRLDGNGHFGVPGALPANLSEVACTVLCTGVGDGPVTFQLSLAITTPGWMLGRLFPSLPDYELYDPASLTVGWITPSFLATTRIDRAVLSARSDELPTPQLYLSGDLPDQPPYSDYDNIVFPWPLRLNGTVVMPASSTSAPTLDLRAVSASATLGIAQSLLNFDTLLANGGSGLNLRDVGFRLACYTDLDPDTWGRTDFSVLDLIGTLSIGLVQAHLSTPVLATGRTWHLIAEFADDTLDVVTSIGQLTTLFGLPELPLPANFPILSGFQFRIVELWFRPPVGNAPPVLDYIALSIESKRPWKAPVPFVTIKNVGTRWVWGWGTLNDNNFGYISGSVYGSLEFGSGPSGSGGLPSLPPPDLGPAGGALVPTDASPDRADVLVDPFTIDVVAQIPSWAVSGNLHDGDVIPIGTAFRWFFGDPGPPAQSDMYITGFSFEADPQNQSYSANAEITFGLGELGPLGGWSINLIVTTVTVRTMSFAIDVTAGEVSGSMAGEFALTDQTKPPIILLTASYPGAAAAHPEGWTFAGDMYPGDTINLTELAGRFLGMTTIPGWVPTLSIDRLHFSFNSGTPSTYEFAGTVSLRWQPKIFDTPLKISASAGVDLTKPGNATTASGYVEGLFAINSIALSARLPVGPNVTEPTYQFKVQFGSVWLQALTSWRGDQSKGTRHQVISLQLGGVTVGDILEYVVNLAQPTIGYTLEPPWDVLKRIDLSRFVLTLDPQDNLVEFVYTANADLVFMKLDTIGVRYSRAGNEGGVSLILTGSILGKRFDGPNALSWDVVNDPPPPLPGQKQDEKVIDLRYLGLGQRVALKDPPDSVAASLAKLRADMSPDQKPDHNPLDGQAVEFNANSQWLIGLDLGVLDTLDIGIIFNDPRLYGLSIQLGGERAGSLAGLRFEILYKKITDDVGMFRIELRVPEAFRHIELGEVSITLGVIVVEIYTNGNFLIDLGFPYNRNYERSFSVQVFPFIGRGGIYFGVLDGNTSRRVPRITNGSFAPVLELGIGLAVGVGKEISIGPLSGGIYVQVEVIFQGVLGWFNPSAAGSSSATYYWGQGIAAIHGKLYGSVDFKIIKVSVTLEAYAQASVVFEAYRPTVFRLAVGVSVEAEVEFLFFSVSFSFDVNLDVSFTIGTEQATPWLLAANQNAPNQQRLRGNILPALQRQPMRRANALRHEHLLALARHRGIALHSLLAQNTVGQLQWKPTQKVFADSPRRATMTMLPCFGIGDVPVNWSPAQAADTTTPRYRAAFMVFADSGVLPGARTAAAASVRSAALSAQSADANTTDYLATDIWVRGFLLYAINALQTDPQEPITNVSAGQLAYLAAQLDLPGTTDDGFNETYLKQFFSTNIHLDISGNTDLPPSSKSGMVIAMPPFLSWASPQGGTVNFNTDNPIGPLYEWDVATRLAAYTTQGPPPRVTPPPDDPSTYQSYAMAVFRDFCLMLTKAAVKEASSALNNFVLKPTTATQSLGDIARLQPQVKVTYSVRAGDTVDSVADALGATTAELEFLNLDFALHLQAAAVGSSLQIKLGVSPDMLAQDNPGIVFAKRSLSLGTLSYQIVANDTFNSIGALFTVPAVNLFGVIGLADDTRLLATGAPFNAPALTYTPPAIGFNTLSTAATFYARYIGAVDPNTADGKNIAWYAQAIFDMNRAALNLPAQLANDQELPPGQPLYVPVALQNATPSAQPNYTTVPGDTLARIGAALNLAQNHGSDTGSQGWPLFRDGTVRNGNGSISLPAWTGLSILAAETPAMLARRTIVNWVNGDSGWHANWPGLLSWIGDSAVLAPLALITVAGASTDATTYYSFTSLTQKYGLTITDAALRLQNVADLYPVDTVLTVQHLPAQAVSTLADSVSSGTHLTSIIAQASRMLLAGAQLPQRQLLDGHVRAAASMAPMLDLTLQQFDVPVDPGNPGGIALSVTVSTNVDWITWMSSTTVRPGETDASLRARAPLAFDARINRGLALGQSLQAGMVVHTDTAATLAFSMTNTQVIAAAPATSLSVIPHAGPAAMALKGIAPRTYGLDHRLVLQSASVLPIPGMSTLSGPASLWPYPQALIGRARLGLPTPYEILGAAHGNADGSQSIALINTTFATLLPFQARRVDHNPQLLSLIGVTTEQRDVLLLLRTYLANAQTPAGSIGYLLLAPSPNADDNNGLAVFNQTASAISLVKTNLSTESVPQPAAIARVARAARSNTQPLYFATLAQLANFILLLWEGSTVGGIGYFLDMGQDVPGSAFDDQGIATLNLLVIAGEQQSAITRGRKLLAFNNCALIASGADPSAQALYVEATDASDMMEQALVPAGNIGFTMSLPRPVDNVDPIVQKKVRLARQYSLLSFNTATVAGAVFTMAASGLPLTPQASDGSAMPLWQQHRLQRYGLLAREKTAATPAKNYWDYQQVIPAFRFGPASPTPNVTGLPAPAADPYRGTGTYPVVNTDRNPPKMNLLIGFGDVAGNRSANANGAPLSIDAGYTDPLLGPAGWPAVVTGYLVTGSGANVALNINVAPKGAALMPSPTQSGDALVTAAIRQWQTYAQIYYQLAQPGISASVLTSLAVTSDGKGQPVSDIAPLLGYAAGAYLYAQAAASVSALPPLGATTLGQVPTLYGVAWADLAQANLHLPLALLFGDSAVFTVPAFIAMTDQATANTLTAHLPNGWPAPSATAMLQLPSNRDQLLLRIGTVLAVPSRAVSIPAVAPSLAMLAGTLGTNAVLLANDSAADSALRDGCVLTMEGVSITIGVTLVPGSTQTVQTFANVVLAFADQGINLAVSDIALVYADTADLLKAGATMHTAHYIARHGDTLGSNHSSVSANDLIAANLATPNLFDNGALIYLGPFMVNSSSAIAPGPNETLGHFANRYACPAEQLLAANPSLALPSNTSLTISGAVQLPASSELKLPYTLRANETLQQIGTRFYASGNPATTLVTLNQAMPGIVVANQTFTVQVGSTPVPVTTVAGDTFDSILLRVQNVVSTATLADIAAAMQSTPGLLRGGALMLCPPVQLAAATAPNAIAGLYNVSSTSFALANAGVTGLFVAGLTLKSPQTTLPSVQTLAGDTFNSLMARFATAYANAGLQPTVGIAEIVSANADLAFLKAGAIALLPPLAATLNVPIGGQGPYPGPAFALQVNLRLQRPPALIHPDFAQDGPVARADSIIPPPAHDPSVAGDGFLNFNAFVAAMRFALPTLRLATGRVAGDSNDLWAVNFGSNGITNVQLTQGVRFGNNALPRFMALQPLYPALVSRAKIPIQLLGSDGNLDGLPVDHDYQGIDAEVWARRFLADTDRLLSTEYASAIYANSATRAQLTLVLDAKATLTTAIPAGLDSVFKVNVAQQPNDPQAVTDPNLAAGLVKAREALTQRLGISLSDAYATTTVIQYDGQITSPWIPSPQKPLLPPANLEGTARELITNQPANHELPWRLTSAKTPLDERAPFVTLMMTVTTPAAQSSVPINLEYAVSNLEFNITAVNAAPGYVASDWLSFVPLLSGADAPASLHTSLGSAQVPIVLRTFPGEPIILGQTADASVDAQDPNLTLANAPLWTYSLSYSHEHAAQDSVLITAQFNLHKPTIQPRAVPPPTDLFTELAKYMAVADELWKLLSGLLDPATTIPASTLAHAVTTFTTLATNIANHWNIRLTQAAMQSGDAIDDTWIADLNYLFDANVSYRTSASVRCIDSLSLHSQQAQPGPNGATWPQVWCRDAADQPVALIPSAPVDQTVVYSVPPELSIPASSWPMFTIAWPQLNVSSVQNARAKLSVTRNQWLTTRSGPATNPSFVFKTGTVTATDIATPLNTWSRPFILQGNDTTAALNQAFGTLFPPASRVANLKLTMGLFYGYQLIQDPLHPELSLVSELPVGLYADQFLTDQTAAQINTALTTWKSQMQPNPNGAEWVFSLTLYSAMDANKRPLLSVERMVYSI